MTVIGNYSYGTRFAIGYSNDENGTILLQNNYFANSSSAPLQWSKWGAFNVSSNTLYGAASKDVLIYIPPSNPTSQVWDGNTYYTDKVNPFEVNGVGWKTFSEWKSYTGFDAASTVSSGSPADTTFVYANQYASISRRKGLVVIYNWSGADSVNVNLASLGLTNGQIYKLRQATDPLSDTMQFTYSGSPVAVDMRASSHSVAKPIAHTSALLDTTFPTFGAFVVDEL